MGVSSNKAYAGKFKNGFLPEITVFYANATTLAHWNRGRSRVHPDNWKAGWYWTTNADTKHPGVGPFSSSRSAYKNAKTLRSSELRWPNGQPIALQIRQS